MELTYDEAKHQYALRGHVIPGVSQLIAEGGLSNMDWVTEEALLRGEYIHKTIELYLKNDLREDTLDPVLKVRLDGFKQFERETGYTVQRMADGKPMVEIKAFHPVYQYAGKFDQLGTYNGKPLLLDLKSGAAAKWHRAQTALYAMLFPTCPARACLYLPKAGGYRFVQHYERSDFDVAKALLTLAAFKESD